MLGALGYARSTSSPRPPGRPGRAAAPLGLPPALSEPDALAAPRRLAEHNQVLTPMIGLGYYGTVTPAVIRRNVLENPGWYTAYTPYQPEISQGRLEALLNFQTMVSGLTGLAVAGASLLDEATAAAEAMTLARQAAGRRHLFLADAGCLPQTLGVLRHPRGTARDRAGRRRGHRPGDRPPAGRGAVRRTAPVPRRLRRGARPRPGDRRRQGAGGARRRRRRPARADPADAARGTRCRHRGGQLAAVLVSRWGTAARTRPISRSGTGCAAVARAAGRGVAGRRRPAGLPARAAGPRTAHPPGEGDQQHLHRAGAAGGDRRDVRGLPRPGRADRHRGRRAPAGRRAGRHAARRRAADGRRRASSTPSGCRRAAGGRGCGGAGQGRRLQPVPGRRRQGAGGLRRDHHRGLSAGGAAARRTRRPPRSSCPRNPATAPEEPGRRPRAARTRSSSATRCSTSTAARPRCCATCAAWPTSTSPWTGR